VNRAPEADRRPDDEERLMVAILDYLAEHPNAMDSMEGIGEFWILRNTVRVEFNKLKQVLARLVECGALEQIESGSRTLFRIKNAGRNRTKKAAN
jgi:hypothetical protein